MVGKLRARRSVMMAAALCALMVVAAGVAMTVLNKKAPSAFPEIGYSLSSTVISEDYGSSTSDMTIKVNSKTQTKYDYSDEGLRINFSQPSSSLTFKKASTLANSVRLVANVSSLDRNHTLDITAKFNVKSDISLYYGVTIRLSTNMVRLIPNCWLGEGTPSVQTYAYLYDVREKGTVDILVEVDNGNIIVGIDGFEKTFETNYKTYTDLLLDGVTFASNELSWQWPAEIVLERFEVGKNANIVYHDRLHTTMTPDGHDFTIALQIHADQANPARLLLLKQLADEYGVRGEFDCWVDIPDYYTETQYSINTSAAYYDALLALRGSGWDITLHAATCTPANRTEVISLIEQFEEKFGPLKSWVDHGNVLQDIWRYGNDPYSDYYIGDYLTENDVMIWANNESQSHSQCQDLNLDTVRYQSTAYPGLDLLKVSHFGFLGDCDSWQQSFAPVTQDELSDRQRIYASNNAVLIWHDYTFRFDYVEDEGINYADQSHANMGYPYTLFTWDDSNNANAHPNGTWHLQPEVEDYFAAMRANYNVWYATPREIYDRSIIMEHLNVSENATTVTITNPSAQSITGLTIFTKERPRYCLTAGSNFYYARQGAESYNFVIPEVPAGGSIVLTKADPSSAPSTVSGDDQTTVRGDSFGWYFEATIGVSMMRPQSSIKNEG
jgi:hypothetical protein